jgi:hypothetical protein
MQIKNSTDCRGVSSTPAYLARQCNGDIIEKQVIKTIEIIQSAHADLGLVGRVIDGESSPGLSKKLSAWARAPKRWRAGGTSGLMIGYAPRPFFAENLLFVAFVGSRTRRWLSLHEPRIKRRLRNH